MLKTLRNALKTGNATVAYPFAPLETVPHMRGKPEHDLERCIACAACAIACPPNAIEMETDQREGTVTWKINYGRCIFCGRCEEACPVEAIALGSEFELAVMAKADMTETCTYTLQECTRCGKPFAPRKEIDYAVRVLETLGANEEAEEAIRLARVCTACKRTADAEAAHASALTAKGGK
ncbi:4Fe-4S binding protein [Eggerthellaceae bacterium zg-1084]|uniref:4Fe-4S binding protein n=1 Tax=Berryella wangjianweii TaxID=2734634 RepID=A0A6M8IXA8_9ACTN|nr:formate hydrogenlyase complex iron-sulfur subunit [Berryella wangjianweii]NPD30773.1 4Fe-4S binding protein [Berryella wangjianweii]NPD32008.1 4Fe-4S binding protein [Eggerthellaceae bacterium zg-997]QKF07405.1 4Fe-4S binding protein [Berryella wangjianweii]